MRPLSSRSRSPERPLLSSAGYMVISTRCLCGAGMPTLVNNTDLFCKRCGRRYSIAIEWNRMFADLDGISKQLGCGSDTQGDPENLRTELDSLMRQVDERDTRIAELEAGLREAESKLKDSEGRCSGLEKVVSERDLQIETSSEAHSREVGDLRVKLEKCENAITIYNDSINHMKSEMRDIEETNNHSRIELQRMRSLDVRSVVEAMMEYAAAVNNVVLDSEDISMIRTGVDARTEKLIMDMGRTGIGITRHRRGDPLGDGRIDIVRRETSDPSEDMRVYRTNSFGASFTDDLYPMIPESVTVNSYTGSGGDDTAIEPDEKPLGDAEMLNNTGSDAETVACRKD